MQYRLSNLHKADIGSPLPSDTFITFYPALYRYVRFSQQILNGQKVTVVRCEELNISGSFFRNKLKYHAYLHSALTFSSLVAPSRKRLELSEPCLRTRSVR